MTTKHQPSRSFFAELKLATRTYWQYLRGCYTFRSLNKKTCITIFGSARFEKDHPYAELAEQLGEKLAQAGLVTITGGGPGIMAAVHRGANAAGGLCVGATILLPFEEAPNPDMHISYCFKYFFVRKIMLTKYAQAFVIFPGGFGTMDEVFEVATLVQTTKMSGVPIILMGSDYWQPLLSFIRGTMVANGTIDDTDPNYFTVTDSPDEAAEKIRACAVTRDKHG